jgi:hypothetical protein
VEFVLSKMVYKALKERKARKARKKKNQPKSPPHPNLVFTSWTKNLVSNNQIILLVRLTTIAKLLKVNLVGDDYFCHLQ